MSGAPSLDGRVVLVTGSARGIGRGIVEALVAAGASVVASVHHAEDAPSLAAPAVVAPVCDVTVRSDVDAAVACAISSFGALDAVVHNAVSNRSHESTDAEHASVALFEEHASVSVRALLYLAQAAYPHLAATRGTFVVMTSPAGIQGTGDLALYAAVKGAQRGFLKALAREWGPDGIRVNGVAPLARSPALERAFAADPGHEARLARVIPMGWFGDPASDIGPAVAFLCSDAARYVTGQTLAVNGGRFTAL